jgi:hypothetical protein
VMARSDQSVKRASDRIEYVETGARYEYLNLVNVEQGEGLSDDEIRAVCDHCLSDSNHSQNHLDHGQRASDHGLCFFANGRASSIMVVVSARVQLKAPVKPKCDSRFGGAKRICHLSFVNGHWSFGRCKPFTCSVLIEALENACSEYSSDLLIILKSQLIIDH